MAPDPTTQCVLFPGLFRRPLVALFDQPHATSDAGAVLLKAADERLGLTQLLADCIYDPRRSGSVVHEIEDLVRQRVFGLAGGYADCNAAARLARDPIYKLLLGRDPVQGDPLAAQPTLCRFENSVGPLTLFRMGVRIADRVIESHRQRLRGRVRRVTIDLDPTEDPTHGAQQLSFFNGHYDSHCYLPLLAFLSFDREPDQYLCAAILRPGNAPDRRAAVPLLERLVERVRAAFPKARIRVRLDAGFAAPEVLAFLDAQPRLDYAVAMAKNKVLERRARRLMGTARRLSRESKKTEHVYGECRYAAKTWPYKRRVIIKAEVVRHPGRDPKDNPRFVVTNLKKTPRWIYERVYCERGDVENRIKEVKGGVQLDRTSCSSFFANQFRVLLTVAAYVLMQEIRIHAKGTSLARAQAATLREHLFKVAAWVRVSVRRIVLHLPDSFPYRDVWQRVALALGAQSG